MEGKIIKLISNDYTVFSQDGTYYLCKSRGKFRNINITPLVGDQVVFDPIQHYILEILPRKNELIRPPVSNIDQVIIITSTKQPDFSSNLLDKLLTMIEYNRITPIICLTKLDLLSAEEKQAIERIKTYYQSIGYQVFSNIELDKIKEQLKGKITVFTGQSGAGKSTLLNRIDPHLNLKTDEISLALGRGKHTTRHTELLSICQGLVADTPGFSSLELSDLTADAIRDNFVEFNLYRQNCKYKDCMHDKEMDCEIKKKVEQGIILKSRYENYLKLIGGKK